MTFVRGMRARLYGPDGEDASFFENGPPRAFTAHEEAESLRRWESEKRRQAKPDAPTARELTTLAGLAAALLGLEAAERALRTEEGGHPQHASSDHAFGWDIPTTTAEQDFALAASHWARFGGELALGVGAMVLGPFPFTSGSANGLTLDDSGSQPRGGNSSGLPQPAVTLADAPQAHAAAPLSDAATPTGNSTADASDATISFAGTRAGLPDLPPDREARVAEAPAEARPAQPASVDPEPQVAAAPAAPTHHSAEASPAPASAEPAQTAPASTQVAWQWTPPEPTTPAAIQTSHDGTAASDSAVTTHADGGDFLASAVQAAKDTASSTLDLARLGSNLGNDGSSPGLESVKATGKDTTPPGQAVAAASPGHSSDATDSLPPGLAVAAASPGHTKDATTDSKATPSGQEVAASAPGHANDTADGLVASVLDLPKDAKADKAATSDPSGQDTHATVASASNDKQDKASDGASDPVIGTIVANAANGDEAKDIAKAKADDPVQITVASAASPTEANDAQHNAKGHDTHSEVDFALASLSASSADTGHGHSDATPVSIDASFALNLLATAATPHPDTIL